MSGKPRIAVLSREGKSKHEHKARYAQYGTPLAVPRLGEHGTRLD